jgi:hypothetical protein
MKTEPEKKYPPVGPFEKATSYCPLYIADIIVHEVSCYFRVRLPDRLADALAERAARVFAHQPLWRKRIQGRNGYGWLKGFMRHWLASALATERPALSRALPDSSKTGRPLPETHQPVAAVHDRRMAGKELKVRRSPSAATTVLRRHQSVSHFVHGCELLAV